MCMTNSWTPLVPQCFLWLHFIRLIIETLENRVPNTNLPITKTALKEGPKWSGSMDFNYPFAKMPGLQGPSVTEIAFKVLLGFARTGGDGMTC